MMDRMTPPTTEPTARPMAADRQAVDHELAKALRHAGWYRRVFYVVVLLVALVGQATGAVERLHLALVVAVPAVLAMELGGIVVLANADVRRRLGEHAVASRALSAAIAAGAMAFNWLAHADHLLGGFFAGMSALGYLVWLMHTENQRRDRLRARGDLPPVAPRYGIWRWVRRPGHTARARALALADPTLGLYGSLRAVDDADAAAAERARHARRQIAITEVLRRKIEASADRTAAEIAVTVYDLNEIAARLAAAADYDGLTALVAAEMDPAQLLARRDGGEAVGPAAVPLTAHVPPTILSAVRHALADRPAAPVVDQTAAVDRSTADQPTTPKSTTRSTASAAQATGRPTDRVTVRSVDSRRLRVVGEPAAVANARLLRERYGDRLPATGQQMRREMGWSKGRVDAAVAAHRAGLDLRGGREHSTPSSSRDDGDRGDDERRAVITSKEDAA